MPETANQILLSLATSHQVGLLRYSSSVVRRAQEIIASNDDDILDLIARRPTSGVGSRVDRLLSELRGLNRRAYDKLGEYLHSELLDLADSEVAWQDRAVRSTTRSALDLSEPSPTQLRRVVRDLPFEGGLLGEWVAGMEQGRFDRLRAAVRSGIAAGEEPDATLRRIRGTSSTAYRDGVLEVSRRSATAIIRTAVNHVATATREAFGLANQELVTGLMWVSTLDGRTSAICRARGGRVYPLSSGPRTPGHLNCRSTMALVLRTNRSLGIDGQVPAGLTYQTWLAGRPAEEQDEILGKSKGRLFRRGGLALDRFVDISGREYTLAELRARDAAAFARAEIQ